MACIVLVIGLIGIIFFVAYMCDHDNRGTDSICWDVEHQLRELVKKGLDAKVAGFIKDMIIEERTAPSQQKNIMCTYLVCYDKKIINYIQPYSEYRSAITYATKRVPVSVKLKYKSDLDTFLRKDSQKSESNETKILSPYELTVVLGNEDKFIRCSYCNSKYSNKLSKCPNCNAPNSE